MFNYRIAAGLQEEKQRRFTRESEKSHPAREPGERSFSFVDRLLDSVCGRPVALGITRSQLQRSGKRARDAAQSHGSS